MSRMGQSADGVNGATTNPVRPFRHASERISSALPLVCSTLTQWSAWGMRYIANAVIALRLHCCVR